MRISRAVAIAGLLALAVAGCSSDSDPDPGTPDPAALASSIAAQATSPAAGSGAGSGSAGGGCADAPLAAKAALTGQDYEAVDMVNGCAILSVVTERTEPDVGKGMCDNVAGEVWQLGVKSIVVVTTAGAELATAESGSPCTAS